MGSQISTQNVTIAGQPQTPTNSSNANTDNDYGFVGGAEYIFDLAGSTKFLISADYLWGVANLNSGSTTASFSSARIIQAAVGVLFPL